MSLRCHSAIRCARTTCPTCAWRHALHVTRRVTASHRGSFYAITLSAEDPSPTSVPALRNQLRNTIDYLRRRDRGWRDITMSLWLSNTGNLKGIAVLGTLGPTEVAEKLGTRWPMTLRPIAVKDLRVEVYLALRRVWIGELVERRYQPVSIFVGPRRVREASEYQNLLTLTAGEPMPVIIG